MILAIFQLSIFMMYPGKSKPNSTGFTKLKNVDEIQL